MDANTWASWGESDGVSIEQRSECVIHDGLGSRGTGEVYELLTGWRRHGLR